MKEDTITYLLISLAIVLVLAFAMVGAQIFKLYEEEVTILNKKMETQSLVSQDYLINPVDIKIIKDLAYWNAREKPYELHVYDCTQFSERLVKLLREKGYEAQCTAGYVPSWDYPGHTWTSVWVNGYRFEIESTTGRVLTEEEYSIYNKKWESRCW